MPPAAALFIADKIIEQAALEGVALSEVERKMLLFCESSPTFTQMNEIFDRDYDRAEYEATIVSLIRHVESSFRQNPDASHAWNEAVKNLRAEDYYFTVMRNEAGSGERPPGDLIRLISTALPLSPCWSPLSFGSFGKGAFICVGVTAKSKPHESARRFKHEPCPLFPRFPFAIRRT